MIVLGIETSCDECSAAVVRDGHEILSNVIATQIELHKPYQGVVPELASRLHTEWIQQVVEASLAQAGITNKDLDAVAVTSRPGLLGSLLVGVSFAKCYATALGIPFIGIDHIRAHLYASQIETPLEYPYLGVLVSGGHTVICRVDDYDKVDVLGTTIDDAIGEAFDKVAKFYDLGFPGGVVIDRLSKTGDPTAFLFPGPSLDGDEHRYDMSYSGLKTAVINQKDKFRKEGAEDTPENLAASFQRQAVVEHPPPVGTGVIDADRLDGTRCRVVLPVREGALRHIVVIQVVGCLQPVGDAPVQLEASASRLFLVCFCTRIFVGKESVVAVIIAA